MFAVVNDSPFAFLTYRYLVDQKVPMIGGGFDGSYYYDAGNENMISSLGERHRRSRASQRRRHQGDEAARRHEGRRGRLRRVAVVERDGQGRPETYGADARASRACTSNNTLEFGSTDVGPIVLGIKNSGADGVYLPLDANIELRDRAGAAAERREDEGERAGDRVQPGPARPAHREDDHAE